MHTIGSGIFIISSTTGRMLLTRRSDSGAWANFGGTMEDFETTYQCAVRELKEETGFLHGKEYTILYNKPSHIKESHNLSYYSYVASSVGEPMPILNDENLEFGWFDTENLPHPMHYGMDEVLRSAKIQKAILKIKGC